MTIEKKTEQDGFSRRYILSQEKYDEDYDYRLFVNPDNTDDKYDLIWIDVPAVAADGSNNNNPRRIMLDWDGKALKIWSDDFKVTGKKFAGLRHPFYLNLEKIDRPKKER